jgi:outer membrane protein, heavy metal efflux system
MKHWIVCVALQCALAAGPARAQDGADVPGADLESLLALARAHNPELAGMRFEALAAQQRVEQADALPDPRFKLELQDVTKMGAQSPALWPADAGSTRYTFTQELPWFGTRVLRREQAQAALQGADAQAQSAWLEVAARIKLAYVQRYFLQRRVQLSLEVLGLVQRLEQLARTRYAGGLAPQQDAIRAQTEQSAVAGRCRQHALHLHPGATLVWHTGPQARAGPGRPAGRAD